MLLAAPGPRGAYRAGVLKALTEAGVKIDVLAGHGAGAMTALCGAIDGGAGSGTRWSMDPRAIATMPTVAAGAAHGGARLLASRC